MSLALLLVLGPFLGLLFVIFLPMAVPLVVVMLLLQRLRRMVPELKKSAVRVATFGQQPGMVYLQISGTRKDEKERGTTGTAGEVAEGELKDLLAEIEEEGVDISLV